MERKKGTNQGMRLLSLLVLVSLLAVLAPVAGAAANEWTWMSGANTVNQWGVYGAKGTPAAGNVPGARYGSISWPDSEGDLWLFGGSGYDCVGSHGYLNDLWRYDPASRQWTWISGANTVNQWGVYGAKDTPADGNVPGARDDSISWLDSAGNLWLFGGYGYDSAGSLGRLNDLWRYDPAGREWTWMSGANTRNQWGVYGAKDTPADGNVPGARNYSISWLDSEGDLWLFGGYGYDSAGSFGILNDLWRYDPASFQWTWMSGADTVDQTGVYGTKGTPAAGNVPSARNDSISWLDSAGDLWLFGGYGLDYAGSHGYLNDLWRYEPASRKWTWMSGANTVNQRGVYGDKGTPAAGSVPGARNYSISWPDSAGDLWLFGGYGYGSAGSHGYLNDLWRYDPDSFQWTWMSGADTVDQTGVYGTKGTPAAGNVPGARIDSISWLDSAGDLWLFGGYGYDSAGILDRLNDLWRYGLLAATSPAAPSDLAATAAGTDQIDLTWTDNASDETGFGIERSPDSSFWAYIASVGANTTGNTTGYADTGLAAGTTFYYRVYAFNAASNSAYSEASATTAPDTTAPAPPANLTATPGDGVVDLAWSPNSEPDLAGYSVYRATASGGSYTALTTCLLASPGYSDGSVTNGTTYYYVVTARDLSGNPSADSAEASATAQWQGEVDVATGDYVTTYGSVSGTYLATQAQDNVYQSITEVHSGGKPSKRHDRLEHIWSFDVTGGNHIFNVDAYRDDSTDADSGFVFSRSTSPGGPWTDLLTVVTTEETDAYQFAELGTVSGTIYVRAVDNNRDSNPYSYDTLHVDHMFLDGGAPPTEPPDPATNPDPVNGATGVSTSPTLTWSPGARADSHDVCFGTSLSGLFFQGNQTGTSFTPASLDLNTTYYWRIDEVNDLGTTSGPDWSFTTRSSAGASTMHVYSIVVDIVRTNPPLSRERATVVVVDDLGNPVGGADVVGIFTGSLDETVLATTEPDGTAVLITNGEIKKPSFTFRVDDVSIADLTLTYAAGDNVITSASYP